MEYREITKDSNLPDDFIMPESVFNREKSSDDSKNWLNDSGMGLTFEKFKRTYNFSRFEWRMLASDWPKEFKDKNGKEIEIGDIVKILKRKPHKMKKATRKANWNYITEDSPLEELPEFGIEVQVLTDDNSDNGECYVILAEFIRRVQDKDGTKLEWCGPDNVIAWFPSAAIPEEVE